MIESRLLKAPFEEFWQAYSMSRSILLISDYDGTLAPFSNNRMDAKLPARAQKIMDGILSNKKIKFVIVSGRPAIEVAKLYGMEPTPDIWGSHGWEFLPSKGAYIRWPIDAKAKAGFNEAQKAAENRSLLQYCEIKIGALAVHWRGRGDEIKLEIHKLIDIDFIKIADDFGLYLRKFNGGFELLAAGRNKGDAVMETISKSPSTSLPVYIGDDTTDEDAFKVVSKADGFGILAGSEGRSDFAGLHLETYDDLLEFLQICCNMKGG